MPKFLTKEYGPFTGGVWVIVIVGGVGLGLVMRKYFNRGDTGEFTASAPGPASDTAVAPAFMGGGTTLNQGEIVAGVLEAIKLQTPPPATTNPTVLTGGSATVTALEQRLAGLIAQRDNLTRQYESLKAAYLATPTTKPAKRAELYAEMEKNQAVRRTLSAEISKVQAELTFAKAKVAAA